MSILNDLTKIDLGTYGVEIRNPLYDALKDLNDRTTEIKSQFEPGGKYYDAGVYSYTKSEYDALIEAHPEVLETDALFFITDGPYVMHKGIKYL